jgi:hypothetical protein
MMVDDYEFDDEQDLALPFTAPHMVMTEQPLE